MNFSNSWIRLGKCDRFDLQTEIWRGRILRAVRDREKQGDAVAAVFLTG